MPDPSLGWQIAKWVWEQRGAIAQSLATVYAWFRGEPDKRGILVIGPGGTGKTTLARLLAGQFNWLTDNPWDYRESAGVENYVLPDDPKTQLVVPPGQHHRRPSGWADVEADIATGKYRGVIVLAAYGYHNLNLSYKHHPLYRGNKATFLEEYLAACRADELRVLEHLIPAVRICPAKLWMLSLVAKQDLWTGAETAVVEHYATGPWQEATGQGLGAKDPKLFRHELVFASLVISNFDTSASERLQKNTEGYDHEAQVLTVRRLFEVIDALRRWEDAS
jgi:hypothetical protein